jgi:hypothetical protein
MDSSTAAQCQEVEAATGGALRLAALMGCRVHERCTVPQMCEIGTSPAQTIHRHPLAGLAASVLVGSVCSPPIGNIQSNLQIPNLSIESLVLSILQKVMEILLAGTTGT